MSQKVHLEPWTMLLSRVSDLFLCFMNHPLRSDEIMHHESSMVYIGRANASSGLNETITCRSANPPPRFANISTCIDYYVHIR